MHQTWEGFLEEVTVSWDLGKEQALPKWHRRECSRQREQQMPRLQGGNSPGVWRGQGAVRELSEAGRGNDSQYENPSEARESSGCLINLRGAGQGWLRKEGHTRRDLSLELPWWEAQSPLHRPPLPLDIPAAWRLLCSHCELTTRLRSPCFFPRENISDRIPLAPWGTQA